MARHQWPCCNQVCPKFLTSWDNFCRKSIHALTLTKWALHWSFWRRTLCWAIAMARTERNTPVTSHTRWRSRTGHNLWPGHISSCLVRATTWSFLWSPGSPQSDLTLIDTTRHVSGTSATRSDLPGRQNEAWPVVVKRNYHQFDDLWHLTYNGN